MTRRQQSKSGNRKTRSLVNLGFGGQLHRARMRLTVYGGVVNRFGDVSEPSLREQTAKVLVSEGVLLVNRDCFEDAFTAFNRDESLR
jgi:hypothetical protein